MCYNNRKNVTKNDVKMSYNLHSTRRSLNNQGTRQLYLIFLCSNAEESYVTLFFYDFWVSKYRNGKYVNN